MTGLGGRAEKVLGLRYRTLLILFVHTRAGFRWETVVKWGRGVKPEEEKTVGPRLEIPEFRAEIVSGWGIHFAGSQVGC